MLAADDVIRTLRGPGDRTTNFSLNSKAIRDLKDGAKTRLTKTLTDPGLLEALADTRRVASLVVHRLSGIPPDVATLDALFLLANEDEVLRRRSRGDTQEVVASALGVSRAAV